MGRRLPGFLYPLHDIAIRMGRVLACRPTPLHRDESCRPVFIVGSGRSGNTLLRRVLQAGGDLHIPPETFVLGRAIKLFLRNRHMPWESLVRMVLGLFEFQKEFDKFEISLRPLATTLCEAPRESRSLAFILDSFYRYHGAVTNQTFVRWGDKTPYNTFSLDLIRRTFPDAQFVHMLRDGADVVPSYVAAGLQPDVAVAGVRWVRSVQSAKAFARRFPASCVEVRYENLVTDADEVTRRVCAFLGITFDPAMTGRVEHVEHMGDVARYDHLGNVAKPITADSVGRGRASLDSAQRSILRPIMERELVACGYDPLD